MSAVLIRQMLETALQAVDNTFATAWENITYLPISDVPYQIPTLLLGTPVNPTITNPSSIFTREVGMFQVSLMYPQGNGPQAAGAKAEGLRAAFFRGKTFTSGLTTLIISGTPAIAPGRVDGDRWSIPVKIPFFANVYG